ncbi:FAD-binding oxidoreductase [Rhodococcus sp. D2-41]|uniref:FAD-binding oxidoreductase n=1 Tax=Speluncibacter jeojiensis TaxID=2710754 RepID=UPI00240EC753|nr:FAD-binding oxidoreductase [Rhodococcus sp. D2-41]MDG3010903.1 FAD-binding oxidoreductase [Rhodococcus sp. D2-41]
MAWDAWGLPERRQDLSDAQRALLTAALGVSGDLQPERDAAAVTLTESALTSAASTALAEAVGADHVHTDHDRRLRHSGGKSTPDLLRRKDSGPQQAPDAVVEPADHDQVAAVLTVCAAHRIAVVPFGGGTSVVGGVDPEPGDLTAVVTLDLGRMNALLDLDVESGTATFGAGTTGPQAEQLLAEHGLSLGHFPQSFQFATLGGFAATRSSGQASAGYGRFDDMVQRFRVVTPAGELALGQAPASAAGPDLRELFIGSEGVFGIITEVTVRVHPEPEHTVYQAWSFPDFAAGAHALRTLAQSPDKPTVLRLSDEAETGLNLALASDIGGAAPTGGCLAITTFEGDRAGAQARAGRAAALLTAAGGTALGEQPTRAWEHGRFDAPYLRDTLLRAGAIAETLETATTWQNLAHLRQSVTAALTGNLTAQGTPALVLCHISHTYPTGASLYFTVVCAQSEDPLTQWMSAKRAAGDAIVAAGGTITHHHAVGRDHRPWMAAEVGELGVAVLRAVKNTVDPDGILNPGKLIP